MTGPHTYAMEFVADILRADERLSAAGVEVILQNDGDLATLVERETKSLDAPVAVVTVDKMENASPGVRIAGMVAVTEYVPLNRADRADFLTALDVAVIAHAALDRHDVHSGTVAHSTPGDGVLEATCAWDIELLEKNGGLGEDALPETETETE